MALFLPGLSNPRRAHTRDRSLFEVLATTRVSSPVAAFALAASFVTAISIAGGIYLALLVRASTAHARVNPISISSDRLDFGLVPFHGTVVRHLVLRNDGNQPIRAWFFASGAGYSVDPRELLLQPGVETRVAITASADRPGQYSGELLVHLDDEGGPLVIPLAARAPEVRDPGKSVPQAGLRA